MANNQLVERVLQEATKLPFFWDNIDQVKCQKRLRKADIEDGTYILRKSGGMDGTTGRIVTLSVKKTFNGTATTVWHFPVIAYQKSGDDEIYYYMAQTQQRTSLINLLNFHRDNPLKGQNLPDACPLLKGLTYEPDFQSSTPDVAPRKASKSNYPDLNLAPTPPQRHPIPSPRLDRKNNSCREHPRNQDVEHKFVRNFSHPPFQGAGDSSENYCDCGLPLDITYLPKGWTVHRSNRDDSRGMLYFRDISGKTSWQIDPDVDKMCPNREYLSYGRLNVENFQQYDVQYVDTSELKNYSNYQNWRPKDQCT